MIDRKKNHVDGHLSEPEPSDDNDEDRKLSNVKLQWKINIFI